jgi:hypothetical protein
MIGVSVNQTSLNGLKLAIKNTKTTLRRELRIAVNATAKKAKSIINKQIRSELAVTAKVVDKTISVKAEATEVQLSAKVTVRKTSRIPLRDFGARQTRAGVSAKVSKTGGRKTISGAFQGPKPGVMKSSWRGRVFKRLGKTRLPIVQLFGPSPWGVMTVGKQLGPSKEQTQAELEKQVQRRIRFITLKKSGAI